MITSCIHKDLLATLGSTMPPQSPNDVLQQMCNAREKGRKRRGIMSCAGQREEDAEKATSTEIMDWNAAEYFSKGALQGNHNVLLGTTI